MATKIQTVPCMNHTRKIETCIWCVAGRDCRQIVVNDDDGFAFATPANGPPNVMYALGPGGVWHESRPNFSGAL